MSSFLVWSGRRGSNPGPSAWKANALSTELLPQLNSHTWAKMDSNHRRRKPADLQSAPFGHSGICPLFPQRTFLFRASCRIRTNDPEITNHVLWPTELKRLVQLYSRTLIELSGCKVRHLFQNTKTFRRFFICHEVFLLL